MGNDLSIGYDRHHLQKPGARGEGSGSATPSGGFPRAAHCTIAFLALVAVDPAAADPAHCAADNQQIAAISAQLQALEKDPSAASLTRKEALSQQLTAAEGARARDCASANTTTADLLPRYAILAVVYAPPGTNGGKAASAVDYAAGSTLGTTISAARSFKDTLSVDASASAYGASVSTGFSTSNASTKRNTVDIKKSEKADLRIPGPAADGIDHNEDRIYLWLNPKVHIAVQGTGGTWGLSSNGSTMDVQYLYVGWLKDTSSMPPQMASRLANLGITAADFAQMLKADTLATGGGLDAGRFVETPMTFPYEPPLHPNDAASVQSYTISNEDVATQSSDSTQTNDIYVQVGVSYNGGIASASLKLKNEWTWTNENSTASSSDKVQSATAMVGEPSYGYSGPTDLAVYYDKLFGTFAFAPVDAPEILHGMLTVLGSPAAGQAVSIVLGGKTFRSFTDGSGRYRIYGRSTADRRSGTFRAGTFAKPLAEVAPGAALNADLDPRAIRPIAVHR